MLEKQDTFLRRLRCLAAPAPGSSPPPAEPRFPGILLRAPPRDGGPAAAPRLPPLPPLSGCRSQRQPAAAASPPAGCCHGQLAASSSSRRLSSPRRAALPRSASPAQAGSASPAAERGGGKHGAGGGSAGGGAAPSRDTRGPFLCGQSLRSAAVPQPPRAAPSPRVLLYSQLPPGCVR